ncbi:hypothetical protein D8674_006367 [Pyrus ussuriensis x Pyrus communis]|uniref:Retrotransposon Copia-like N-terminal domain-containing protein n=1 Tax=Pyrus ussuriensis x Pyrus communis TaxID=2448454 RepID=A0A5N5FZ14_9ROSA|nr:hypothetical protein D8674_006367 [Pyrus ussuriensis x Pyrus communis]
MVNPNQLVLTQSPISSLIPSMGNQVTVKLNDSNYVNWSFQLDLLLEGNGILGFIDGLILYPSKTGEEKSVDGLVDATAVISDAYKIWKIHDKALMTLIATTLSPSALSFVIGCQSSKEMSDNLRKRFASITRTSIVQMKIDLHNIKKGHESIDKYLQQIKDFRDQLTFIGVTISDEDIVIVALRSLPSEYNTIKVVIRGRESLVSLKERRSQLKAEESTLVEKQIPLMSAMYAQRAHAQYDQGATNHMTSDITNLQAATPYPSHETVTGANGEV